MISSFRNEDVFLYGCVTIEFLRHTDLIDSIIKEIFGLRTNHASNFSHTYFISSLDRTLGIRFVGCCQNESKSAAQ